MIIVDAAIGNAVERQHRWTNDTFFPYDSSRSYSYQREWQLETLCCRWRASNVEIFLHQIRRRYVSLVLLCVHEFRNIINPPQRENFPAGS